MVGYTKLEYIASTGTQYIDTGYSGAYKVDCEFAFSTIMTSTLNYVCGAQLSASPWNSNYFRFNGSTKKWESNASSYAMSLTNNTIYHLIGECFSTRDSLVINDTNCFSTTRTNAINTNNVYLFCVNNGGSPLALSCVKLYSCKMYNENGVMVRDFVPVKRNSDDVAGLYDNVNDTFYPNAGTGTFVTGRTIISAKMYIGASWNETIKALDYIVSTGTQNIDTGISGTDAYGIEVSFIPTSLSQSYQSYFGGTLDNFTIGAYASLTSTYIRVSTSEVTKITTSTTTPNIVKIQNGQVTFGSATYTCATGSISTTSNNIFLFDNATTTRASSMKLYYCKIYDSDGNLLRDYVPAERNSKYGLYDRVTSKFFGGAFTGGNYTGETISNISYENKAKQVTKAYIGVNGIAKQVTKAYIGVNGVAQLCYNTSKYDYGDGSLNKVQNGYDGLLYINGELATAYVTSNTKNYGNSIRYTSYSGDNWDSIIKAIALSAVERGVCMIQDTYTSITAPTIKSGTQLYSTNISSTDGEKTVHVEVNATSTGTYTKYGKLAFNVDGTLMDLDEMIDAGIIKPLVLISSAHASSTSYIVPYVLNMFSKDYTGTTSKTYTQFNLQFMLNKGHTISQVQLYSSSALSNGKFGYAVTPIEYARITLNPY